MVIISGRRRIGKTTLANPAFTNGPLPCRFFHISDEKTAETNVEAFWRFNAATLGLEYFPPPAATIAGTIEFLLKQSAKTPMTVVLDEFQNAETVEPALVTDLSVLWDKYRKDTQLLLVLTVSDGAGRSMTDDHFSPLCARACGELTLRPFSTGVIKTILTEHYPTRKPDDLLTLFAVTGGIPQYIKVLTEAGCTSARRMIRSVAQPRSYFQRQAETLLKTAFKSDCQVYFELLQRIAEGKSRRSGLVSYSEGNRLTGTFSGWRSTSGLSSASVPWGHQRQQTTAGVSLTRILLSGFGFCIRIRHSSNREPRSALKNRFSKHCPSTPDTTFLQPGPARNLPKPGHIPR